MRINVLLVLVHSVLWYKVGDFIWYSGTTFKTCVTLAGENELI